MDEDHRISRAAAPAKCGDVAEELAYRLRQQKLTAAFGEYALRARDVTDMLQEASRVCALGLNSQFCKVMEYLLPRAAFWSSPASAGGTGSWGMPARSPTADAESRRAMPSRPESGHLEPPVQGNAVPHAQPAGGTRHPARDQRADPGDGDRYGVLEVDSPNEGWFQPGRLAFLQGFANLIGVALERHRVEEALRASEPGFRTP